MLAGMGWQPGTGLGASREGIVTPIESKLRPRNMGIAFKGFDEKTSQAKQEAKRRARREGLPVSSDEEKPGGSKGRKSKAGTSQQRADAWKKPRKSKHKVEHKTYEQILAETAQETSSVGIIIDATGAQHRELSSLAELASVGWIPSQEPTHIPEVRHNMRLIANGCKSDLEKIAQEARLVDEAKKRLALEDKRLRDQADQEAELISRLQALHLTVDELSEKARELEQLPVTTLDAFETVIEKLTTVNPKEYSSYHVDEIVVAALAPSIRKIMLEWDPLANPESMAHTFHAWRQALQLPPLGHRNNQNPDDARSRVMPDAPMTPYESLLWNVWMPKIRSTINNEWLPSDPKSLTGLYEEWKDILPSFVQDNVMDQLILPKVQKAVSEWNSRSGVPLQTLVFPWLPHLGLRTEGVLSEACRKVKALLRSWDIREGAPPDLVTWKEMFSASEWESMILKYVIPKLGASMRADFKVNPRKQEMATLNQVISWHPFVRPSVFSQLLETEFFPKWLDALHLWLTAPSANYEEIARWYDEWKKAFPVAVRELSAVQEGFERATKLMHDALSLGPKAAGSLPRPEHRPLRDSGQRTKAPATPSKVPPSRTAEITFRALVEDFASSHNLLFIPLGRSHPTSRMPLYRVSAGIDGKNGLTVFIMDDAVWLVEGDDYHAISLEDMILRATKITRS
ncbi:TFP11-domain-containing protein [Sistotremastrum suecicum HHB10207 ss-3]|uniref:TFP11-domain-containing protein n=1 Tax=Sistotremastrum suecicum HHB10207 ss-3 TaxID=1314776 RepID=A0A166CR88_9AGAM|nr:TFP11-domain-containing protein [Sistotremastrum suecicum HHB10207 ss-3]